MKKRPMAMLTIIAALLMLFVSCNEPLKRLENGDNINELLFPYLRFTMNEDGNSCSATVMKGAKVQSVRIPACIELDDSSVPVREFTGFEDPQDITELRTVILPDTEITIRQGALDNADKLESCTKESSENGRKWGDLPAIEKDGMHFLGWFAGDEKVTEGLPIDPACPKASPRWEKHALEHVPAEEASCTEEGSMEYWHCSECGRNYSSPDALISEEITDLSSIVVPALGHSMEHHPHVKETCLEDGNVEYWECTRCQRRFSDADGAFEIHDVLIPKTGHREPDGTLAPIHKTGRPATCEEQGTVEYWFCRHCGLKFRDEALTEILEDKDFFIPALGHRYDTAWTNDEFSHWHICLNSCGSVSDKADHIWDDGEVIKEVTPDENGQKKYTCTVCGRERYEDIPATGHDFSICVVVPPTCTEKGYTRLECSLHPDCGKYIIEEGSWVPPLNHKGKVHHGAVPASCETDGNIEYWYCGLCGKFFTDEACTKETDEKDTVLKALGHDWSKFLYAEDPDTHWYPCLREGCDARKHEAPHDDSLNVIDVRYMKSTATCKSYAVYWQSCECGHCSRDDARIFQDVKSGYAPHELEYVEKIEPTCTESGLKAHWKCSVCGRYFEDEACEHETTLERLTIAALGHDWSSEFYSDDEGHWHKCLREGCGAISEKIAHDDSLSVVDERYLVTPANCTDAAVYHKSCECGHESADETFIYGKPLGHDLLEVPETESTCLKRGNIRYWKCSRYEECHACFLDAEGTLPVALEETLKALSEHSYVGNSFEITKNGHRRICDVCGKAGPEENHVAGWLYDRNVHWQACECGQRLSEDAPHDWIEVKGKFICRTCGCVISESIDGGGGFGADVVEPAPVGHIVGIDNEDGTWTFSLELDVKTELTRIIWMVNGVRQTENGEKLLLDTDSPESFRVMCIFSNDQGSSSSTMVITGKKYQ